MQMIEMPLSRTGLRLQPLYRSDGRRTPADNALYCDAAVLLPREKAYLGLFHHGLDVLFDICNVSPWRADRLMTMSSSGPPSASASWACST